jgi:Membrane proteins related to metalloendopeptidases
VKIIIMHARKNQARRLTVGGIGLAALLACTLGAAAGAGALIQRYSNPAAVTPEGQTYAERQCLADAARDRQALERLAARLGAVQARLDTLEGLGRRVAQEAGVDYGALQPDAAAAIASAPDVAGEQGLAGAAGAVHAEGGAKAAAETGLQQLEQRLERMHEQVSFHADGLSLLDGVLTWRSAGQSRLPTAWPIAAVAQTSSSYGWRRHPVTGRHAKHEGLDIAAPPGTPILAASAGVVVTAKRLPGYGNTVEIDHGDGIVTRYAHARTLLVQRGDVVAQGQPIAAVGSSGRATGPHLHFEVRIAGEAVDPTLFLAQGRDGPRVAAMADSGAEADGVR